MSYKHKIAATLRGAARTERMVKAVKEAICAIQADMQRNGGIYPHNGGAVSTAELARRAGISESTFYKKAPENLALKDMANLWLDSLKKKETVGRMRVKKSLEQRAEDWHQKYLALEQRHIQTELELQSLEAKLHKFTTDNAKLVAQLSNLDRTKITPITAGKH